MAKYGWIAVQRAGKEKGRLPGFRPLTNPSIFSAVFFGIAGFVQTCFVGEEEGCLGLRHAGLWCFGPRHCDLLDVLGCGGQQALACDADLTSEAGIAVAVQLLGVGKGAFDRLLSAFVDRLAPGVRR